MSNQRNSSETEELVRLASEGDAAAVDALLLRHRERLKRMVRLRMDPRVAARVDPSDVIQEAFVTALEQLPGYLETEPIPFYPWLRRIGWETLAHQHERHIDAVKRSVRNERAYDWQLSDNSATHLAGMFCTSSTSPSGAANREELRARVRAALDELYPLDREVLLQRYLEQLSVSEIAAVLDKSKDAVHMRHLRALEKVHQLLGDESP